MIKNVCRGIGDQEKPILVYDKNYEGDKVKVYTELGRGKITAAQLADWRKKPFSRPFVPIPCDSDSLKDTYDLFVADAKVMKEASGGLINMHITGRNPLTAMNLAYHFMNKNGIGKPDDISPEEADWIEGATHGAIIFAEKYKGPAWKYDINSAYPSIYSSSTLYIPVKQGEFMFLDNLDVKYFRYGIYRCVIEYPNDDPKWKKLFRLNFDHYYTHYDMNQAKELGLSIRLITDVEHNFLYWSKEKLVCGKKLFGEYVELLYELKSKPETKSRAKQLLNCLWGTLCQDNVMHLYFDEDEEIEIDADNTILEIIPHGGGYRVKVCRKNNRYETNFARMKPFLLAKGRNKISDLIQPHVDHVKRCHTDSIVSCVKLPFKHSDDIGKLKYEGQCKKCNIVNAVKMEGDFE